MLKTVIGIVIISGAILVGAVIFGSQKTIPTASDPAHAPQASLSESKYDFGSVGLKEVRDHIFTVRNQGQGDLLLTSVSTSCDCTYAYITIKGQVSPKFTMHGTTSWQGTVAPGESAELKVVYEPAIMPVNGPVERSVSVATNDPNMPTITASLTASVHD